MLKICGLIYGMVSPKPLNFYPLDIQNKLIILVFNFKLMCFLTSFWLQS